MTGGKKDQCIRRWTLSDIEARISDFRKKVRRNHPVLAVERLARWRGVKSNELDVLVLCQRGRNSIERSTFDISLWFCEVQSVDRKIKVGHDLLGWASVFG